MGTLKIRKLYIDKAPVRKSAPASESDLYWVGNSFQFHQIFSHGVREPWFLEGDCTQKQSTPLNLLT